MFGYLDAMLKLLIFVAATSVLFFPTLVQAISNASWLEESILGLKKSTNSIDEKSIFGALIQFFPLSFKWIPSTCCSMHFDFNRLNEVFETKMYLRNVNLTRFSFSRIRFLYSVLFSLSPIFISLHSVLMGRSNVL